MRKSNSKEARRAVEAYVLDTLKDRSDNYDNPDSLRLVSWSFEMLREEMNHQSDETENGYPILGEKLAKKYRAAGRHSFIIANTPYWVWYLAVNAGCFAYYYYDMRQDLAQWLEETPEEADQYSNDQVMHLYRHMTASAFERLYDRENKPHKIPTSEFRRILEEDSHEHYFFDRKTMKYHRTTMKDVSVTGFYLVTDYLGNVRDCYKVESMQASDPDSPRHLVTYYFDRETLSLVSLKER